MNQDSMPKVARYWNGIAAEFDAIYTGANKSALGRALDRFLRKDIYGRFDWVMRQAGDVRGKRICDIGCGSGRFVTAFGQRGAAHVTGIDVAPDMLKLAERLACDKDVGSVCDFVQADVLDWRTDEQFDVTIAIGLWDYIADPTERLRLIRKITRPGGVFLSTWPRFWTWRMPVRKIRLTMLGCPVYFFRRSEICGYLAAAGFQVETCEVVGKLYCVRAK